MEVGYEFRLAEQHIEQGVHIDGQNGVDDLAALVRRGALRGGHKSEQVISI